MKKIIYGLGSITALIVVSFIFQAFKKNKTLLPTETYVVTTLAGNGENKSVDGKGDKACFSSSLGHLTTDAKGNVYVIDGSRICKITPDGETNTLFGQYVYDSEGNPKEIAQWINGADGICLDNNNNLFISQQNRHMIIKIDNENKITDYAGDDGHSGGEDGLALSSGFHSPRGLCMDKTGNIYVADPFNGRVRKISADGKTVSSLAGKGRIEDFKPGIGKAATFIEFYSTAVDSKGNVYIEQNGRGSCIAKITPAGVVSMFAGDIDKLGTGTDGIGKAAHFLQINAITVDAQDNIYVAENSRIRKITSAGVVTTIAGTGERNFRDGPGNKAMFKYLNGIAVDASGNIYVSDFETFRIRKIAKITQ